MERRRAEQLGFWRVGVGRVDAPRGLILGSSSKQGNASKTQATARKAGKAFAPTMTSMWSFLTPSEP